MNKEKLLDDLVSQIYINSEIAVQKYARFNSGFKYTILGFFIFIFILIIGIYIY